MRNNKVLEGLNNSRKELFSETYEGGYDMRVQWLSVNSKPKTIKEKLVDYILKESGFLTEDIKGIEHWTHLMSPKDTITIGDKKIKVGTYLEWHTNKDEILNEVDKYLIHPVASFIYFPIDEDFEGGYLEISSLKESDLNPEIVKSNDDMLSFVSKFKSDYERIKAKYNRLIIFDSSHLHRVTQVTKGVRWSFTFDIWNNKTKEEQNA